MLCALAALLSLSYLIALWVVRHSASEDTLLGYLTAYLPAPLQLLPVLAGGVFCLLLWEWPLVWVSAAILAIGVLTVMPPNQPGAVPPSIPSQRIRIVSWNTHEEYDQADRIREVIAELKPDIVCLQEARRNKFYGVLPGGAVAHTHEVTTLTRGRLLSSEPLRLGELPNFRYGMDTEILLPQGRLRVLNVHYVIDVKGYVRHRLKGTPAHTHTTQRSRELENAVVLNWLDSTTGPRAVVGDFNTPPGTEIYSALAEKATNAFAQAGRGWGFTYHRRRPLIRIDHVWCAGGVQAVRCYPMDGGVSDHRVLVTDVIVPPTKGKPGRPARRPARPKPAKSATPEDTR